jgi:hypothetical protein
MNSVVLVELVTSIALASGTPIVDTKDSTLCFNTDDCVNVLVGKETPLGEYPLVRSITSTKGYGGEVLAFNRGESGIYAIHRVWTQNPKERRLERIRSSDSNDRIITKGCINVDDSTYNKLKYYNKVIIK